MSRDEDMQLIRLFLDNDRAAFDKLVAKYKNMIFTVCFRILGDFEEAEDSAQETFIKVFKNLTKFRFDAAFSTWLYRIAVNTCKNKLKSLRFRFKKKTVDIEDVKEFVKDKKIASDVDRRAELNELDHIVRKTLDILPDDQRIVIVLRDIEGRSYEEISGITGFKEGTVKSKLSRARSRIRKTLEGHL